MSANPQQSCPLQSFHNTTSSIVVQHSDDSSETELITVSDGSQKRHLASVSFERYSKKKDDRKRNSPVYVTLHIMLSSYFYGFKSHKKFVGFFTCLFVSVMISIHLILSLTVGSCATELFTSNRPSIPCDSDFTCQSQYYINEQSKQELILPDDPYIETKYCDLNTKTCKYKNSNSICSTVFDDLKYGGFNTSEVLTKWWTLLTYSLYHIDFLHLMTNVSLFIPLSLSIESLYSPFVCVLLVPCFALGGSLMVLLIQQHTILVVGASAIVYGFLGFLMVHRFFNPMYSMHILLSVILMITCVMCFFLEKYFMPSISVEGHVGGFLSGIIMSLVFFKVSDYRKLQAEYKTFPYYKISPSIGKRFMKFSWIVQALGVLLALSYFGGAISFIFNE